MTAPPPSGRLYWICQAAGWGSFTAYVLIGYLFNGPETRPWDIVSIVFFNAVASPVITHELRRRIHLHDWLDWPVSRFAWLMAGIVIATSAVIAALVALGVRVTSGAALPPSAAAGIFIGFCWAYSGWIVIYYAVHAKRRREALQMQLTIVAREAQLRALRAQLNPHFLFNCLNSLRHLIGTNPDRAVSMVTGLAELLRYSLRSDTTDVVSLAEELQVVDEYLELERVRLEERLRIERTIDPEALRAHIPPMLIQTLVDNAIKHGIAQLPRGGVVRIDARVVDGRVEILVANTGRLGPSTNPAGHGLRNATERLRLLYGDRASLTLTEADGMTRAALTIPLRATEPALRAS